MEGGSKKIRIFNKTVRKMWSIFTETSESFLPPENKDTELLMNLFGRKTSALSDQIKAIRQIVQQGGNTVMVFDRYQNGKNVDLALLASSYQRPDLFLEGDAALKNLLIRHERSDFPLIARYLPNYFKTAQGAA